MCFNCGKEGHLARDCPNWKEAPSAADSSKGACPSDVKGKAPEKATPVIPNDFPALPSTLDSKPPGKDPSCQGSSTITLESEESSTASLTHRNKPSLPEVKETDPTPSTNGTVIDLPQGDAATVPTSGPAKSSSESVPFGPEPRPLLEGYVLNATEVQQFLLHQGGSFEAIETQSGRVPYKRDNRMATNRSTLCIEEDLRIEHLVLRGRRRRLELRGGPIGRVGLVGLFFFLNYLAFCLIKEPCPLTVGAAICETLVLIGSIACIFTFGWESHAQYVSYVPHLVTCAMTEYSRGTNLEVVQSTLRQKFRRLASLPIPAKIALELMEGTEVVCLFLVTRQAFFTRQVAGWVPL